MAAKEKEKLKLPGESKGGKKAKGGANLPLNKGEIITKLSVKDLKTLLGKGVYPCYLDFSSPQFQLESDEFIHNCPDVVKELDLTSNCLTELGSMEHLKKLKRLVVDKNSLQSIVFTGLENVVVMSLAQNRLEYLSDMSDLKNLKNLNLSGNRLTTGFAELGKLKNLRSLDLSRNQIDLNLQQFYSLILVHLKKLPKLQYLSFAENPLERKISKFKYFVIAELPKLQYLDWELISKEDRAMAGKLESQGKWKDKSLPAGMATATSAHSDDPAPVQVSPSSNLTAFSSPSATAVVTVSPVAAAPGSTSTPTAPSAGKRFSQRYSTRQPLKKKLQNDGNEHARRLDEVLYDDPPPEEPSAAKTGKKPADDYDPLDELLGGANTAEDFAVGDNGNDPLDDILNYLEAPLASSGDLSTLSQSHSTAAQSTSTPSSEAANGKNYLDMLSEMISDDAVATSPSAEPSTAPAAGGEDTSPKPVNYLEMLYDMINKKKDSDSGDDAAGGGVASDDEDDERRAESADHMAALFTEERQQERLAEAAADGGAAATEINIFQLLGEIMESSVADIGADSTKPRAAPASAPAPAAATARPASPPARREPRPVSQMLRAEHDELQWSLSELDRALQQSIDTAGKPARRGSAAVAGADAASAALESEESLRKKLEAERKKLEAELRSAAEAEHKRLEEEKRRLEAERREMEERLAREEAERKQREEAERQRLEEERRAVEEQKRLLEEQRAVEEQKRLLEEQRRRSKLDNDREIDELKALLMGDVTAAVPATAAAVSSAAEPAAKPFDAKFHELHFGEKLGAGVFGTTFKGHFRNREAVLKRLKCTRMTDDFLEEFRGEVAAMVALPAHRNVVATLGCSTDRELVSVSEYVHGVPLYGFLRNQAIDIELQFIVKVAREVAHGMQHLHANGIIHKSLKTKNIIIDQEMTIKLRDYGLLSIKREVASTGAIGTPQYTAPELLGDPSTSAFSEKVDVYSFGIVLYELFARESAFDGLLPRQIVSCVLENGMRPPVPLSCPSVLAKLMISCWATDPARRPAFDVICKILDKPVEVLLRISEKVSPVAAADTTQPPMIGGVPAPMPAETATAVPASGKIALVVQRIMEMLGAPTAANQLKALKALGNIARQEENRHSLIAAGVAGRLAQLCRSADDGVMEHTARAVVAMATDEPSFADEFRDRDGISPLVGMLAAGNEAVVMSAARALVQICANNHINQEHAGRLAIPQLINLLKTANDFALVQITWALGVLLENEANHEMFSALNGIVPLLRLIRSNNPAIQLRVLVALANLLTGHNEKIDTVVRKAGAVKRFVTMLSSPSPLLRQQAAEAAIRFANKPELRSELIAEGGLTALVALLADQQPDAVAAAAHALAALGEADARCCEQLADATNMSRIVGLLTSNRFELQADAASLFSAMFVTDYSRQAARSAGAIVPLVALLTSPNPKAQQSALSALARLDDPESLEAIVQAGVVPALSDVVKQPTLRLQTLKVLSNISTIAASREQIVHAGFVPDLVAVLQSPDVDNDSLECAATTVAYLCDGAGDAVRDALLNTRAIDALARLATHPSPVLQERIIWGLSNVATFGTQAVAMLAAAAPKLCALLQANREPAVISLALKTVLLLAKHDAGKRALVRAGAVQLLEALGQSPNRTIQLAAIKGVDLLTRTL